MDRHLALGELDGLARARHRVGPAAADLDRAVGRRPLRDRADEPGECRLDRLAGRRRTRRPGSARPRGRRSWTRRRSRPWRGRPCGRRGGTRRRAWRGRGRPAARRTRTDRACRRGRRASSPASRRTRATMSCDVGPAGLATTRMPSSPGPGESAPRSATERGDEPGRLGEDGGRASSSGRSIVAPAARAWPPPPNLPVRTVASTPPGLSGR